MPAPLDIAPPSGPRDRRSGRWTSGPAWVFYIAAVALAVLLSLGYLAFFHLLTMNAFEPPIWTACAAILLRIVQTGNQKLWLWFGLLAGIGLENKYGILFFGLGVFAGLVLTRERKAL